MLFTDWFVADTFKIHTEIWVISFSWLYRYPLKSFKWRIKLMDKWMKPLFQQFDLSALHFSTKRVVLFPNHLQLISTIGANCTGSALWAFRWTHCLSFLGKRTSFLCKLGFIACYIYILVFSSVNLCCTISAYRKQDFFIMRFVAILGLLHQM